MSEAKEAIEIREYLDNIKVYGDEKPKCEECARLQAQLNESHKYLQEALRMQADEQIVIDRYKNHPETK